jgi:hypothetical protein
MTTDLRNARVILEEGGYLVGKRTYGETSFLLAETLYSLVMVVSVPTDEIDRFVDQMQAHLTQQAALHPSARRWDLYLVLVVGGDSGHVDAVRERFEADTRYARKLVVTQRDGRLRDYLRPLLPLEPSPDISLSAPLREMRRELLAERVDADIVEAAIRSFEVHGEVRIP